MSRFLQGYTILLCTIPASEHFCTYILIQTQFFSYPEPFLSQLGQITNYKGQQVPRHLSNFKLFSTSSSQLPTFSSHICLPFPFHYSLLIFFENNEQWGMRLRKYVNVSKFRIRNYIISISDFTYVHMHNEDGCEIHVHSEEILLFIIKSCGLTRRKSMAWERNGDEGRMKPEGPYIIIFENWRNKVLESSSSSSSSSPSSIYNIWLQWSLELLPPLAYYNNVRM